MSAKAASDRSINNLLIVYRMRFDSKFGIDLCPDGWIFFVLLFLLAFGLVVCHTCVDKIDGAIAKSNDFVTSELNGQAPQSRLKFMGPLTAYPRRL